jgi:hypothetical protein
MALDQAKAADSTARSRLALAQAYKAILDAQSRAADVTGKNDEREFDQVLSVIDQHNELEAEDREHDLRVDQHEHDKSVTITDLMQRQRQQETAGANNGDGETK